MKLHYYLLTFAYCAAIFWMSSGVVEKEPPFEIPGLDKLLHAGAYGVMAAIVSTGIRRGPRRHNAPLQFYVPFLFSALYGVSDEIHQYFVPGRNFDLLDMAANAAGALVMSYLLCWKLWRIPPRDFLALKRPEKSTV